MGKKTAGNLPAVLVGALAIGPLIERISVIGTLGLVMGQGAVDSVICLLISGCRERDHSIGYLLPVG